jgi:hypothetical protein
VQAPFFSQSYNRYAYVFNSPLSFTDPSGYACVGDSGFEGGTVGTGGCFEERIRDFSDSFRRILEQAAIRENIRRVIEQIVERIESTEDPSSPDPVTKVSSPPICIATTPESASSCWIVGILDAGMSQEDVTILARNDAAAHASVAVLVTGGAVLASRVGVGIAAGAAERGAGEALRDFSRVVTRTTRSGGRGVELTRPDGSQINITAKRVREWVPNTHPSAPPGTRQRVRFPNAQPGTNGFKRDPTPEELRLLDEAFK